MAYLFIEILISTRASKFVVYKSGLQWSKQFHDETSAEFIWALL
jgi:hypothetical protein